MKKLCLVFFWSFIATAALGQNINDKLVRVRDLSAQVRSHGLQSKWYFSVAVEERIAKMLESGQHQELDQLLSATAARIATDLYRGRLTPDLLKQKARIEVKNFSQQSMVNQFLEQQISASQLIQSVHPKNTIYTKARSLLSHLESLKVQNLWTVKPAHLKLTRLNLNINNKDLVIYLRLKLTDFGYTNKSSNTFFDEELKLVVEKFQQDHNLVVDGIVGSMSWAFLERPLDQLITQAILNLDRTRWLPDEIAVNYVFVNLAQQRLQLIENSVVSMDFKTINGRHERQTPMLVDQLKRVILNPTWTVPTSLILKDKAPILKDDPGYIERNHMVVIDNLTDLVVDPSQVNWSASDVQYKYTIVQSPGPWNALGFIKFPLTNPYAIYLHDTNERSLFSNDLRLLSSGCVRLVQPFEFAEKILNNPEWTVESLKKFTEFSPVQAEKPTSLSRKTSLPVYLFYQTIFFEEDGRLITLNDHYEIDKLAYGLLLK